MKHLFLATFFTFSVCAIAAQQDQRVKSILDTMRDKITSYEGISADFVFSMKNNEMDIDEENRGTIKLKGNKYLVELPEIGINVYSDGKTVWNYMQDGNQVTISNMEDNDNELMDPAALFSIYEKGFRSAYIGETTRGTTPCHQIELYPDQSAGDVTKVVVHIGKTDHLLKSVQLFSTDGNLYAIEVKSMNNSGVLPDNYFIFNPSKFPDVEVIDFR